MPTFQETLRSIVEGIVARKDNEALSKLYRGIHTAEKSHPCIYSMYPSHLRKHAACHTDVDTLVKEWAQYIQMCTFDTARLPVMWYLWTNALDDTTGHVSTTAVVGEGISKPGAATRVDNGDVEELHSSNHRMYMIARRYKRNIKTLKSKYADRKRQVREFAEWYNKFERNAKTLHTSLSSILRYVHTTVDTADSTCACPSDEEMQSMSFEELVRAIAEFVNDRSIAHQIDAENIQSYHLQADNPLSSVSVCSPYPYDEEDEDDADECDSVVSSVTDILDPDPAAHHGWVACAMECPDGPEGGGGDQTTAHAKVDPAVHSSIRHIDQLLREACVINA